MDSNGRVIIPTNKLGQYLIDVARLYEGMASYRDKKLLETYLMSDPPLHPRRTLDQAYYGTSSKIHLSRLRAHRVNRSLNTTRARDRD